MDIPREKFIMSIGVVLVDGVITLFISIHDDASSIVFISPTRLGRRSSEGVTNILASDGSRDVSSSSFGVQKDDAYTGRRRVAA